MRTALGKGIGVPWLPRSGWEPTDAPGMILWLEGDTNVTYSAGFSALWGDQTEHGNNFSDGANVPFYSDNSWTGM